MGDLDNRVFLFIAATIVILVLVFGGKMCVEKFGNAGKEGFRVIRRSPLRSPYGGPDVGGWGGRFRGGPHFFTTGPVIPGTQYGPLPPGRGPYGGRCDCHYESGHIKYKGGKCYRPWGPRIDPRDSCYDLRNY